MAENFETFELADPYAVLVISQNGGLGRVACPFPVVCKTPERFGFGPAGLITVEEVLTTAEDRIVYIIGGKPYYHSNFDFVFDLLGPFDLLRRGGPLDL